ncbi:hypothetical protein F8M41_024551 [Gigaspora margarita]|uniref:Uncharacterized protein n=1 Tax=Gigaspora margarita TaxID=4874 RepID=A0A8H4ET39_GIGMA|nr:hypothetical protein F8M41_024551 [Gigaspora margarita]
MQAPNSQSIKKSETQEAFRMHNKVNMLNQNLTNENEEDIIKRQQKIESKLATLQHLVDHVNEELNANNLQHVEAIIYNLNHALQLSQDIEKAKNQRMQHMTWYDSKPWTLFLN